MQDKFKIVAVADPDSARCDEAAAEFACRIHRDAESLIHDAEVDLVVVASPNRKHPAHSIQALKAGKKVKGAYIQENKSLQIR